MGNARSVHSSTRVRALIGAFILLLLPLATRAADTGPVTEANVAQRVQAAKTAADHEALAAYFQAQSAAAAQKVKDHEAMLASFNQIGGRPSQVWKTHCESLIKSFRTAAKDYQMLAQEQSTLAKDMGGQH